MRSRLWFWIFFTTMVLTFSASSVFAVKRCKGTKRLYKGACRYQDDIQRLKSRAKKRKKRGDKGGKCLADAKCHHGLRCKSGRCVKAAEGSLGGACYGNQTCNKSLLCQKKRCVSIPTGSRSGPCYGNKTCDAGLVCQGGTCQDKLSNIGVRTPIETPRRGTPPTKSVPQLTGPGMGGMDSSTPRNTTRPPSAVETGPGIAGPTKNYRRSKGKEVKLALRRFGVSMRLGRGWQVTKEEKTRLSLKHTRANQVLIFMFRPKVRNVQVFIGQMRDSLRRKGYTIHSTKVARLQGRTARDMSYSKGKKVLAHIRAAEYPRGMMLIIFAAPRGGSNTTRGSRDFKTMLPTFKKLTQNPRQ